MTARRNAGPASPHRPRRWCTVAPGFLLFLSIAAGCASVDLHQFERHAADHDFAWIAARTIRCQTPPTVCARLHLIQGDACLRLADAGTAPARNYARAAEAFEKGLALTDGGEDPTAAAHTWENLCAALDGWIGLQPDKQNQAALERFAEAARRHYRTAPGSLAAVYYMASVRRRQLQPQVAAIDPASRLPVCNRLRRTTNQVLSTIETARVENLPDGRRWAERYDRLVYDLGRLLQRAGCH